MEECHLEGCPCRRLLPEELGVDSVHCGEVLDVLQQHGRLHHVPVVAAGSLSEVLTMLTMLTMLTTLTLLTMLTLLTLLLLWTC